MNANINSQTRLSDGHETTIFSLEIEKLFNQLSLCSKNIQYSAIDYINLFFGETNKKALLNYKDDIVFEYKNGNKKLSYDDLSSGEKQLVYIIIKSILTVEIGQDKTNVLLLDEPEISLHLSWQEKLLNTLSSINPNGQIILATHSPAIVMNGYMRSYIDFDNIAKEIY